MDAKLNRRQFLRAMALVGGSTLIAACGAQATSQPAEPTAAAPVATEAPAATVAPAMVMEPTQTSVIDVTYWGSFSGGLGESEKAMVDSFNASQSNVKVNYQFQGNYEETAQKLTAALQAKQTPEISLLSDVWWFKFYIAGALQPVKDLMAAAQIDPNDYVDSLINEGTRKGDIYWTPFARSTPLFYYNKDMFAAVGLPDRGPTTWAEFSGEWAPKLMQLPIAAQPTPDAAATTPVPTVSPDAKVMAFAHPNGASYVAWLFQGVTWQHGGKYSDPDFTIRLQEENGVRAGKFYQDSVLKDKWAYNAKDIGADFINGLTATTMASTGGLKGFEKNAKFKVGTAFLPEVDQFGCCTGGAGLSIMAGLPAEKQQAAMQFIAYATSPEGTTTWSQATGYMPVRKSAMESDAMKQYFAASPNAKTAVDQLAKTLPQDSARVFIPGGDQIIGKGLERLMIGGEDVATVFADVKLTLEETGAPIKDAMNAFEA